MWAQTLKERVALDHSHQGTPGKAPPALTCFLCPTHMFPAGRGQSCDREMPGDPCALMPRSQETATHTGTEKSQQVMQGAGCTQTLPTPAHHQLKTNQQLRWGTCY